MNEHVHEKREKTVTKIYVSDLREHFCAISNK